MHHNGIPPMFIKLTRINISSISCLFFISTGISWNEQRSLSRLFDVPDDLHNGCQLGHERVGGSGQDAFNGHYNNSTPSWFKVDDIFFLSQAQQHMQTKSNNPALMAEKNGTRIATLEYLLDFQRNRAVYLHFYCKPYVPVWLRDLECDTGHLQSFFKRS